MKGERDFQPNTSLLSLVIVLGDSAEAEIRRFKDAGTTDTKDSAEINRKTNGSKDA